MEIDAVAKIAIPFQHYLYFAVMSVARFNLNANSYGFLLFRARRDWTWCLELVGVATFWTWFIRMLLGIDSWKMIVAYVLVANITASPLHIQVSPVGQLCRDALLNVDL